VRPRLNFGDPRSPAGGIAVGLTRAFSYWTGSPVLRHRLFFGYRREFRPEPFYRRTWSLPGILCRSPIGCRWPVSCVRLNTLTSATRMQHPAGLFFFFFFFFFFYPREVERIPINLDFEQVSGCSLWSVRRFPFAEVRCGFCFLFLSRSPACVFVGLMAFPQTRSLFLAKGDRHSRMSGTIAGYVTVRAVLFSRLSFGCVCSLDSVWHLD